MTISPHSYVRQILHPALLLGVAVHLGTGEPAATRDIPIIHMTSSRITSAGAVFPVIPSEITMPTSQQHRVTIRYRTCITEILKLRQGSGKDRRGMVTKWSLKAPESI